MLIAFQSNNIKYVYMYIELGKFLKEYREKSDLTQLDVALLLGFEGGQMISNVERGMCTLPPHAVKKLAKLYKFDLEKYLELLGEQRVAATLNRLRRQFK